MFYILKNKKQNDKKMNRKDLKSREKMAKRIMGKDSGRRVFGFSCSPKIHAQVKMLAEELQVPMFALLEHLLQLSINTVSTAKEDVGEREELRRHLVEHHVNPRTIEKFNYYDEELARDLNEERIKKFSIYRTVREIVEDFVMNGMDPRYIAYYLNYGYRCFQAYVHSQPFPQPTRPSSQRKPQPPKSQPTEDKVEENNDS